MNILKRSVATAIRQIGNGLVRAVGPLRDNQTIMRSLNQLVSSDAIDMGNIRPYEDSIWVYASINTIARNASKVPLLLVERNKIENKVTSGPTYDLFKRPNPYMTTKVFIEAVSIFLNIYGESIIASRRKNVAEAPKELWPLNPSKFEPILKKITKDNETLIGWNYTGGSEPIPFAAHEILLLKYFNPYDQLRGLSPLKAAKLSVEQHYFSSLYNKNFFKQGVRTSGFISVEGELDDPTYNRIINQFEEQNAGVHKAHRVALIEGGAKFTESKYTQKDMEFIKLNKLSRTETFASYKTNEVVLGIYDAVQSYEGIRMAHKAFWEECMVPHISYIEEYLNDTLLIQLEGGKYKLMFDLAAVGPLHDDYKVRIDTAKIMTNMGFPLNDVNKRLELGMPEYEWGKTWFVPWGAIPVEAVLENPFGAQGAQTDSSSTDTGKDDEEDEDEDDTEEEDDTEDEDTEEKPKPKPGKKPSDDKPKKPKDMIDDLTKQMWNRYLSAQMIIEDMIRNKVKRYLFEQRKMVIEAIAKDKTNVFDMKKEHDKLQRLLGTLYIEIMKIGATMVTEELEAGDNEDTMFNMEFPEVIKYLQTRLSLIPTRLLHKIKDRLDTILNSNSSKNMKTEQVRALYNKLARSVGMISRNESSSVLVVGRLIQMQRLGVKHHKWISSRRVTSRSSHLSLNNKTVRIGESFSDTMILRYPGDLMAPISETSGCTCFTVPDREATKQLIS